MRIGLIVACAGLMAISACTGSPATLATPPDFELMTPSGISSVSTREPPPDMTDAEFAKEVAKAMELALPGSRVKAPVIPPYPSRRIVCHANRAERGVYRLVVNAFDGSVSFAYEEQVVDKALRGMCLSLQSRH
jgi:hypothetical protein